MKRDCKNYVKSKQKAKLKIKFFSVLCVKQEGIVQSTQYLLNSHLENCFSCLDPL